MFTVLHRKAMWIRYQRILVNMFTVPNLKAMFGQISKVRCLANLFIVPNPHTMWEQI